jgi:hypothetical protein
VIADLPAWIDHLHALADSVATCDPPRGAGPLDRPFGAAVRAEAAHGSLSSSDPPEVALWRAFSDPGVDGDAAIGAPTDGPLFPSDRYAAIEVWTEADLCGLHALWGLARDRANPAWADRVDQAREWHIANTQPDNATNRPWALHVFLLAGHAEGRLYAETLLHNALAVNGRPDPMSAWILVDAARRLEGHLAA